MDFTVNKRNEELIAISRDNEANARETGRFRESLLRALTAARLQAGTANARLDVGAGGGVGATGAQQPIALDLLTHPPLFIGDMGSDDDIALLSVAGSATTTASSSSAGGAPPLQV